VVKKGIALEKTASVETTKASLANTAKKDAPASISAAGGGELINDDEFEALLDQLHGKGKGPSITAASTPAVKPAAPAAKAETPKPKVEAPKGKS